jgi:hypothetical protein
MRDVSVCVLSSTAAPAVAVVTTTNILGALKPATARFSRIEINTVIQLLNLCLSMSSTENLAQDFRD